MAKELTAEMPENVSPEEDNKEEKDFLVVGLSASAGGIKALQLEKYAPPAILVNHDFDVLYMSESVGRFLRFSGGEPSNNLLKMVHPDLLPDLRAALFDAQRMRQTSEFRRVRAVIEGREVFVNLIVRHIEAQPEASGFMLVVFNEDNVSLDRSAGAKNETVRILDKDDAGEAVVRRLDEDLRRAKNQLRSVIEQHEVSIEELKASNEEWQAINEELRTTSEELEMSKEELQAVNEELITVNHELKEKIEETTRANSDLQNLMAAPDIATIFLDRNVRIKSYTPPAEQLFNITPTDIGRPLEHFTSTLDYDKLPTDAALALRSLLTVEREISDRDNRHYLTRILPYRTTDDRVDGVVLHFLDITERKQTEKALSESEERFRAMFEQANIGITHVGFDGRIIAVNPGFCKIVGYSREELEKLTARDITRPDSYKLENVETQRLIGGEISGYSLEKCFVHKNGSTVWATMTATLVRSESGEPSYILSIIEDITTRRRAEVDLRESENRLQLIMNSVTDYAIVTTDERGIIVGWNTGAEKIYGYAPGEIIGQSCEILFTPEDRAGEVWQKDMRLALEKGRADDERFHLRRDGTRFYGSGILSVLKDGKVDGFVKICRDQTQRMKAEAVVQEKEMLRRLVAAQEEERRRIARDIHDHFGQQLTALRLKLDVVKKMCDNEKIGGEVDEAQKVAVRLDADIDFIAWELRPAALDDLGLRATLENFVREWAHHTETTAEFHVSGFGKQRLDYETETNLYRVAQEALNNIWKHAKAKNVSVLLEKREEIVVLIIEDDGAGFDVGDKKNCSKGLGLTGMSERAKILGGEVEIESAPGQGTTIFARVPLVFREKSK